MQQMYTIFDNDIPIYLTNNSSFLTADLAFLKDDITIEQVLAIARTQQPKGIFIIHDDVKELFNEFKWYFKVEKAAGGLVKNGNDEILFIYRFDKWDLPKGKIEKKEKKKVAAIREVEEECGIDGLHIVNKLQNTYHIFQRKGRETLKITYWYEMSTDFNGGLTPQLEEGITKVEFKNVEGLTEVLNNTYGNIRLLLTNQ